MKLLVDNKIPFFREYLKKIKNHDQFIIKYFDDNNLKNDDCLNADALFIRSTTRVNSELLSNSPIKFIGSAEPINFIGEFESSSELTLVVDLMNNASAFKQSSFLRLLSSKYLIMN